MEHSGRSKCGTLSFSCSSRQTFCQIIGTRSIPGFSLSIFLTAMLKCSVRTGILLPPANEVWGKVIFLHLFVILFLSRDQVHSPGVDTPPPEQTPPRTRYTPPGTRHTPWDQVPLQSRHPPGSGAPPWEQTSPSTRHTPLGPGTPPGTDTPQDQEHPPGPGTPPGADTPAGTRYAPPGPGTPPPGADFCTRAQCV